MRQSRQQPTETVERKARVMWPKLGNKSACENFDRDIDNILSVALLGNVERRIRAALASVTYAIGKERYGV
jgi:hypothetical protein